MAADSTFYRLAPQVRVRFVGLYLVMMAVIVFVQAFVLFALGLTPDLMILTVVLGLIGLVVVSWLLTSRAYLVQVTSDGYEVRMVRGAGVKVGRWAAVEDAVTTSSRGTDVVVFRLKDGGTTTIPLELLAVERDEFIADVASKIRATR